MAQYPIIGVPTQTLQAIDGVPDHLPLSWVMNHRYYVAVAQAGGAPFMIPLLDDERALRAMYETLDGVFLAGGVDMDPPSYGEEPHEWCGRTDPARDRVELLFTRWALADGKPILGVCRGMQVINVAMGGTLLQDCTQQLPGSGYERDYLAHEIDLTEESRLRAIFGAERVHVNSMHHQGICQLGEGLMVTAVAPDGLAEALETADGRFVVGVQWHPEMLIDDDMGTRRLFESFVQAAAEFARR
jgi:putative glutamine amidotransferase